MKGIGPVVIMVIALVLLITTLTGSAIFLAAKSENIIRTLRETDVIYGINSLELIKNSLSQSLAYASYQAFYTISANGGYIKPDVVKISGSIPYWRIYDDTSGYAINWDDNLEAATAKYLNEYGKALKNTPLSIPDYTVKFSCASSDCTAKASGKDSLKLQGSFYELTDKPDMTKTIKTSIKSLFDKGSADYFDRDAVKDAINSAKNSLPSSCTQASASSCGGPPNCESLYQQSCTGNFKDSINQKFPSSASGNIQTDIKVIDTQVTHTTASSTVSGESSACGCAQYKCETANPDGSCKKFSSDCTAYNTETTVFCTYNHYGAAKILVSITDMQNKYPVYDFNAKTTEMRNTKLNFYVISGSDYATKDLINP